ncbi:MAG: hypothetical protein WDO14_15325 [Bacteroidota bacterium]
MNSNIYMKGDVGFKPVVLAKLGGTWIHGCEDYDKDILSFSIPEHILLEDFKEKVGTNNIVAYNLLFMDEPTEEVPKKFIPGAAITMSIWTSADYHLNKK